MREILFRGKRKDNGKWVEGFYHCVTDNYTPKNIHYITTFKRIDNGEIVLTGPFEVIPETIGEYTGVTDIFGEKVFEGDYIYSDVDDEAGIVKFDEGEFVAVFGDVVDGNMFADIMCYCHVFGNVHDNPELLKGE